MGFEGDLCRISVQDDAGNWKSGFIDRTGEAVISPQYHKAGPFSDGLSCVRKRIGRKSKFGYIDVNGKVIVPLEFDYACTFSNGRAYAVTDGQAVIIDRQGRVQTRLRLDPKATYVSDFSEGFADIIVTIDGREKSGFIDETGNIVIPVEFDHADPFQSGLARASKDGVTGYINREGKFIWSTRNWGPW